MDSGFMSLRTDLPSGKMSMRALTAARTRLAKRPQRSGQGMPSGHIVKGLFMTTPEQFAQHIHDTDAVWSLEGFARTPFTERIAAALQSGEMTMEQAIEAMQKDLQARAAGKAA